MKKFILTILIVLSSMISFSQIDYPIIETDSLGRKVLIMTIEQAQKVDNNFELVSLLEKASTDCDNLNMSYIKVIDDQKREIALLEVNTDLLKSQIIDKDKEISNLKERLENAVEISNGCESQKIELNGQIDTLKGEVKSLKRKRNIGYGTGLLGVIGGVLLIILIK